MFSSQILVLSCYSVYSHPLNFFFFFFNDTATTEIYTLSLHDALPITSAITVWYHAAAALTSNEEVRTVTVTTDTAGFATVNYASPHGSLVPNAVVASGVDPKG